MFIVIVCESVSEHLRGYLSRFLSEVYVNTFVGNVSRRVSDDIWGRVKEASLVQSGSSVMIRSNRLLEQGFEIETFGKQTREANDFDGIFLFSR